jgi:ubiquinone/menaquinone biosynthesis C-methylase UbiE
LHTPEEGRPTNPPAFREETIKVSLPVAHHCESAPTLFQQQWQLYRKFVDNNYFYYREVYGQLHRILVDDAVQPFRFLDIACGDASATVEALKGTRVAHYHGIDLSQAALELASKTLETLACPVTLDHRDLVEALRDQLDPIDVAWIGLSLHHLLAPAKLTSMREIRGIVGDRGLFLIYENASPDGEDRDAWLRRWERENQPLWTALTPEEYEAMRAHVRANDFPETIPVAFAGPRSRVQPGAEVVRFTDRPLPDVLF